MKASTVAGVFALCALATPALASPLEERAVSVKTKTVTATINHTTTKTKTKTTTLIEQETIIESVRTTKTVTKPVVTVTKTLTKPVVTVTSTPKAVTRTTVSTLTLPAQKASTVTVGTTVLKPTTVISSTTLVVSRTVTKSAPATITQVQTVTACLSDSSSGSSLLGSASVVSSPYGSSVYPSNSASTSPGSSSSISSTPSASLTFSTSLEASSTSTAFSATPTTAGLTSGFIKVTNTQNTQTEGQCAGVYNYQPFNSSWLAFQGTDNNGALGFDRFSLTPLGYLRHESNITTLGHAYAGDYYKSNKTYAQALPDTAYTGANTHVVCSVTGSVLDCMLGGKSFVGLEKQVYAASAPEWQQDGMYNVLFGNTTQSGAVLQFVTDVTSCSNW